MTALEWEHVQVDLKEEYSEVVPSANGKRPIVDETAAILVTGDSFVHYGYPVGGGFVGHLAKEMNQPVSFSQAAGTVVGTFQDMFRDPSILAGKKAVVWIINGEPFGLDRVFPETFRTPAN